MGSLEEDYPEHAKLMDVAELSQVVGEFIEHSGYVLAKHDVNGRLYANGKPINEVLAEYFEIDQAKLEEEKRAMIAKLREGGA